VPVPFSSRFWDRLLIRVNERRKLVFGNPSLSELDILTRIPPFGLDWNVIARRINAHHDALAAKGTVPNARPGLMGIVSTQARSEALADILGVLLLPAIDAARNPLVAWCVSTGSAHQPGDVAVRGRSRRLAARGDRRCGRQSVAFSRREQCS